MTVEEFIQKATEKRKLFKELWEQEFSKKLKNRYHFDKSYGTGIIFLDNLTWNEYEMIEEFFKKNYTLIKKGKYKTLGFDKWEGNNSIYIKNLFDIF